MTATPLTKTEEATGIGRISTNPWYPVLIAATLVMNLWVTSGVSLLATTRSFAVATIGAGVILLSLTLLTRRPHVAGCLSLLLITILTSQGLADFAAIAALAVAVPAAALVYARIQRVAFSWARVTQALNILAVLLMAVALVGGVSRGTYAAIPFDLTQGSSNLLPDPASSAGASGPDILVLLLDGYPRQDALTRLFGGDNQPFVDALVARGFQVASENQSNYPFTQATLTSMLYMRPMHEISDLQPVAAGDVDPYPHMRLTLNENPAFAFLRDLGYTVIASSPGYEHVTLRQADVFLDDGSLNEFERQLIRSTTLQLMIEAVAPGSLANQHRDRIVAGFEFFRLVASHRSGRTFALIHVPSPHMPVVVDQTGALLAAPPSVDMFRREPMDDEARLQYLDQIDYLNQQALDAIDTTLAGPSDDDPIIIVMSDHGALLPVPSGEPWESDHYTNLFAFRAPPGSTAQYPDDTSPVNMLPILFNAELGGEFATWPDESFEWEDVSGIGRSN